MIPYRNILRQNAIKTLHDILQSIIHDGIDESIIVIEFSLKNPNIIIPQSIRDKYVDKTAISLEQDCFLNLSVENNMMSVDLMFGDNKERITIPFDSVEKFSDMEANVSFTIPSVSA